MRKISIKLRSVLTEVISFRFANKRINYLNLELSTCTTTRRKFKRQDLKKNLCFSSWHGKCPFTSWSFSLFSVALMLSYIFSIHLCTVHFVAIHHKTGIIKCLYILNVEWDVCMCSLSSTAFWLFHLSLCI